MGTDEMHAACTSVTAILPNSRILINILNCIAGPQFTANRVSGDEIYGQITGGYL